MGSFFQLGAPTVDVKYRVCLGGGIGRRKGLKIPRGLTLYEFDSRPRHQTK
jgi:hypothetical protein